MPLYEYVCPVCDTHCELLQSMAEREEIGATCPNHNNEAIEMTPVISSNQLVIWKDGQYRGSYDQEIRRNPGAIRD